MKIQQHTNATSVHPDLANYLKFRVFSWSENLSSKNNKVKKNLLENLFFFLLNVSCFCAEHGFQHCSCCISLKVTCFLKKTTKKDHFANAGVFKVKTFWLILLEKHVWGICWSKSRKWHMRLMPYHQHDLWPNLQGSALISQNPPKFISIVLIGKWCSFFAGHQGNYMFRKVEQRSDAVDEAKFSLSALSGLWVAAP